VRRGRDQSGEKRVGIASRSCSGGTLGNRSSKKFLLKIIAVGKESGQRKTIRAAYRRYVMHPTHAKQTDELIIIGSGSVLVATAALLLGSSFFAAFFALISAFTMVIALWRFWRGN
jgi:hypothetical protein